MMRILFLLTIATAGGWVANALDVPVGWLIGAMTVGVVWALQSGPLKLHPAYSAFGQAVLGLAAGVGFPLATLSTAAAFALPLVVAVVVTVALSLWGGVLLGRYAGLDPATGFIGSLPGGAPSMVALAEGLGADPVAVALLQYLRVMMVVFIMPPAVGWLFPAATGPGATATAGLPPAPFWLAAVVLAGAGLIGGPLGERLRIPSPTFLGPFLLVLAASWTLPFRFVVPAWLFAIGMVLVGLVIGLRFEAATARRMGRAVLLEALMVTVLMVIGLGLGYGFHLLTGVDVVTAVLGSTPGGMDIMVAASLQLGGDPGLALAMHMVRWLLVVIAGPWISQRLLQRKAAG